MNLIFNKTFKNCCTWLLFGLLFMGFSPDAIASTLTIKNEGDCAVNIYRWLASGDVYQTTLQSGQNFQVNGSEGDTYRAVDTDNVWSNLLFDQHRVFNANANQTWRITPNYCVGASNCSGEITDFQLNRQDGSALTNLANGATFCESDFSNDVKVRALVSGSHESLKFTIIGPNGTITKTENYLTYDSGQFWLSPGEYTVKAELFSQDNLAGDLCDTKMISFTVSDCNAVTIPTITCDGDFEIDNIVRFVYSSETSSSFDLPAVFHNAPFVKIPEVITSDSYSARVDRNQANEELRLIFLKDGVVTGTSEFTEDLRDNVETAFFQGSLPDVTLAGGADEVIIAHPGDRTFGVNITNSPNSLDLTGLCLMAGVAFDPCVNGAPVATVTQNDPTCGNNDGKFTFSFGDVAGRTNIEFSIDGGITYPHNVLDGVGSTMITDLAVGSYDLYVRWGNDECPVSLGTFNLADVSQAPGTTCNDQDANTENDVILADGCTCQGRVPVQVPVVVDGGTLAGGPFNFCVDGVADNIPANGITLLGGSGPNRGWVVTDDLGNILGLPPTFTAPDFDAAGVGTCFVYYIAYADGLTGLAAGNNLGDLAGNFDLSNGIEVVREICSAPVLPNVSIDDVVVNEADVTASLTVAIDQVAGTDIIVDFVTRDETANAGVDYAALIGSVTIPSGEQFATVTFDILEDSIDETDEVFNVVLSNPQGADISGGLGTVTILDNDNPAPAIPSISIDDVIVNEADGQAKLTVTLSQPTTGNVTVSYATADNSAGAGVDYATDSGLVTIPAGQTSAMIFFDILEDTQDEVDELFDVNLSNPQGATIADGLGTVTILDNDDSNPGTPANGCSAGFTVDGNVITITGITGAIKTVKVLDEAWNAVFSCDEWSSTCNEIETVTIASCGTYHVQIQTYADWNTSICDVFETIAISDGCGTGVDCPGLGLNFGDFCDDGNAGTINDVVLDDCGCYGTPVSPGNGNGNGNGNGTSVPSTCDVAYSVDGRDIFINNITGAIRSVKVLDADWGTIFSCDDWTTECGSSEVITVPDCGSYFVQVHTYADWNTTICDIFETVVIDAGCGTGPSIFPVLSIGDVVVNEADGTASLAVSLDQPTTGDVTVDYSTGDNGAIAGVDYGALNGVITIPAGQTSATMTFDILEDTVDEIDEVFDVVLSNPQGATIADGIGTVTIIDNDDVAPVIPNISIDDVVVNEADGTASLTIAIDQLSGSDVTIDYGTTDGTAIAGIDYTTFNGTITIPAGQQFVTVTFDILEDTTDEADEVFNVVLSNPQGAVISGGLGTVTILDNDDAPTGPVFDCVTLGANIGDACDDGNADTNNDLVQADCSCAGTPMNNPTCAATYTVSGRTITVSNVTGAITAIKIVDNNWGVLFSCDDWSTPCQETEVFTVPSCGTYFVQVQTYADWNTIICNLFETVVIDSDCNGNGVPTFDCPALSANIGDACDDGNNGTANDVITEDCVCLGTSVTPGNCDNVTDSGVIAGDETLVAGTDASPILNEVLPSGGSGAIEYIWLSSTDRCPRFLRDTIPGATSSSYDPGVLTETTYFVRCARRAGCIEDVDWQFGESNCVVKEVVASSPSNICADREALNTRTCRADILYGVFLEGEHHTITNGRFVEFTDGTAEFTGIANGIGDINVLLGGRVDQQDSVKFGSCLGETPTDDWYFYTSLSGTIGDHSIFLRGPIFQIGTGANVQQGNEFGGAVWFDTHDGLRGDINIRLTGAPEFCQAISARVNTTTFNAQFVNGLVELDWTDNSGSITDNFEVERSTDGVSFESIGTYDVVSLDDTPSFYSTEDGSPLDGFNYYRLKVNYSNGTFEYSDIRTVKISDIEDFGLFPNPARGFVNVSLKGYTGKDINIQLIDQMGQAIKSIQLDNVEDNNYRIELDGLTNGMYSFWIFAEGTKPVGKKMIVNKQY